MNIPVFFIPSFYGDLRLEPDGPNACTLYAERLSPGECKALNTLEPIARKKGWLDAAVKLVEQQTIVLKAPMVQVAKIIARALKPSRKIVTAVRFSDGKLQEITETEYEDATPLLVKDAPYRVPEPPKAAKEERPEAAAAVARPTLGCPVPDFEKADVRATAVLHAFLAPEQRADWDRYNRFITVGAVTGHRYMITSRHAKDTLARVHRSLYDLDDKNPLCVHDFAVPAAEEVLALHLLVQLPNHENYLRHLEG